MTLSPAVFITILSFNLDLSCLAPRKFASLQRDKIKHVFQSITMSAQALKENRLFINGEFVPSVSGKTFDLTNPTTEENIASVYEAGAEDVDLAVKAAKAAFPAWSALSAEERCDYLIKLANEIEKNEELFMHLEAIAMGMPQSGTKCQ